MIHGSNLSEQTNEIGNIIERAADDAKKSLKKKLEDTVIDIYDELARRVDDNFSYDTCSWFKYSVAHEVKQIITGLLIGDMKTIKNLDIVSEYTFDRLHEVRMKIWETCSEGIEQSIIKEQKEQIEDLSKQVLYYRNRVY